MTDFEPYLAPRRFERGGHTSTASEAMKAVPEGARVFIVGGAMTPLGLADALNDARGRWSRIEIVSPYMMTRLSAFEHPHDPFTFVTTQASPAFKYLWDTGAVDVLPCSYADLATLFLPDGVMPCDVAMIQVSPPGPEGRYSLGLSVGAIVDVVRSADVVIAQVNQHVPYTFGVGELELVDIDHLVEIDRPILESRPALTADPVGLEIAAAAAEWVPDGSTIQFGLGALPDAILSQLRSRRDLKVHSGMVSEACIDLIDAGAVEGPMLTAELVSTPRLMEWVHRNPLVQTAPAGFTHGAAVLAALEGFVTLNSTLEVALDGACNSEMTNGVRVSGPGGAPDYAFATSGASNGRSIVALRSTAAKGTISRIVSKLDPPESVTLPSYVADVFVTEHGSAQVRGLPYRARADAIRGLADPAHRDSL